MESGTHRLSRRAASHAESWLPGRPSSRVAGNRGGERLKRGGGRGLAEWTLIVHRGSNSSVKPRSPTDRPSCYFFALIAAAKPCRSADATAHRRSPRALPGDALGRRTRESGRSSIRALRQVTRPVEQWSKKHIFSTATLYNATRNRKTAIATRPWTWRGARRPWRGRSGRRCSHGCRRR